MIQIVMKPDYDVKSEGGENCYRCLFNGEDVGLRVWGKRASHAEEKMMVIFREQLKGKVVDYDLEAYLESKKGQEEGRPEPKEEPAWPAKETQEPEIPGLENV